MLLDKKQYTEDINNLLVEVRNQLTKHEVLDDKNAFIIISKIVLERFEENNELECEDLEYITKKLFYKTREKLNILKPLIDNKDISEIMINGKDKIFYEKKGIFYRYELGFDSDEELEEVMHVIAGSVNREINELNPIVDARLPDGSRVNGVYKNVAVNGPTLTIRKFLESYISMEQLVSGGTVNREGANLLKRYVESGANIFISGGTSSGKTTLINALSEYIPRNERVIIIEDSAELKLEKIENLVQLECRNSNSTGKGEVSLSTLIKNSLRMRPDRIIIGEVRGEEVFHMLQAMNTGHSGMSTGHANSIEGMLKRLETMYLMAVSIDINAIRKQIADAIDVMVHIEKNGSKRSIVEVSEILGYENGEYIIKRIMKRSADDNLEFLGGKS